jgi:hypothetical protein
MKKRPLQFWSMVVFFLAFSLKSALCQPPPAKTVIKGLAYPAHVALDGSGSLYIVDQGCISTTPPSDCNVYKETPGGSTYTQTLLSSWTASNPPLGVAVDNNGNVYIAVLGTGIYQQKPISPPPTTQFSPPTLIISCPLASQVNVDNHNNLLVVDAGNNAGQGAIIKEPTGQPFVDCAPAENNATMIVAVNLTFPQYVTADAQGDIFTSLYGQQQVVRLTPSGSGYTQTLVVDNGPNTVAGIAMNLRQTGGFNLGYLFVSSGLYHEVYVETPLPPASYNQIPVYNDIGGDPGGLAYLGNDIFMVDSKNNIVLAIPYGNTPGVPGPPTALGGIAK